MYEEIVKALRNCGFPYDVHYCRKCVCQLEHGGSCDCRRLFPLAADAIEKLTDRNVGKWINYLEDGFVECPFCHSATNCDGDIAELHYCFNCGAKLEDDEDV